MMNTHDMNEQEIRQCILMEVQMDMMPPHCITLGHDLGGFTPSYILHARAFGTYLLGGLVTLQKRL